MASDNRCVFEERGYRCVWFQCERCGWYSHSADESYSASAAEWHIRKGHPVVRWMDPHESLPNPVALVASVTPRVNPENAATIERGSR